VTIYALASRVKRVLAAIVSCVQNGAVGLIHATCALKSVDSFQNVAQDGVNVYQSVAARILAELVQVAARAGHVGKRLYAVELSSASVRVDVALAAVARVKYARMWI
jgi:hypothetical protein